MWFMGNCVIGHVGHRSRKITRFSISDQYIADVYHAAEVVGCRLGFNPRTNGCGPTFKVQKQLLGELSSENSELRYPTSEALKPIRNMTNTVTFVCVRLQTPTNGDICLLCAY